MSAINGLSQGVACRLQLPHLAATGATIRLFRGYPADFLEGIPVRCSYGLSSPSFS